mgnify:CR=1 FL=1
MDRPLHRSYYKFVTWGVVILQPPAAIFTSEAEAMAAFHRFAERCGKRGLSPSVSCGGHLRLVRSSSKAELKSYDFSREKSKVELVRDMCKA